MSTQPNPSQEHSYEYWRTRILYSTMLGYILFYFIRKNISKAMPLIEEDLGISKVELGIFLTAHGLLYSLSRFVNGIIADRVNPRWFMATGLLLCVAANGLTGICGYASMIVTGWGVGYVAKYYDWNTVFLCLLGASFMAVVMFLFVLNAAAPEQLVTEKETKAKKTQSKDCGSVNRYMNEGQNTMQRLLLFCTVFAVSAVCFGQTTNRTGNKEIPTHYTFVPRNLSKEGDYKVVVVPAINPRQARLDAQTYHIGWDAIEARMGQSRVMYDVLLKKRKPYVPGTPPVTRRIPKKG